MQSVLVRKYYSFQTNWYFFLNRNLPLFYAIWSVAEKISFGEFFYVVLCRSVLKSFEIRSVLRSGVSCPPPRRTQQKASKSRRPPSSFIVSTTQNTAPTISVPKTQLLARKVSIAADAPAFRLHPSEQSHESDFYCVPSHTRWFRMLSTSSFDMQLYLHMNSVIESTKLSIQWRIAEKVREMEIGVMSYRAVRNLV